PTPPLLYTLSLHDALPISLELALHIERELLHVSAGPGLAVIDADGLADPCRSAGGVTGRRQQTARVGVVEGGGGREVIVDGGNEDRKSTRLNSSHVKISYA